MALRLGINATTLWRYVLGGFNRYTVSLVEGLRQVVPELDVYLFATRPIAPEFSRRLKATEVIRPGLRHALWEQAWLPRALRRAGLDVFHAPGNWGLPFRRTCAYVLTIHDMIGRAWGGGEPTSLKARVKNRVSEMVSARRAHRIITVSEHSKRDIIRFLRVPEEKIHVIPEAAGLAYRPLELEDDARVEAVKTRLGIAGAYLLYVGAFDRRKNLACLLEGYAASRAREMVGLVLAGTPAWEFESLKDMGTRLGIADRVHFPGFVAEEDLPLLYAGATAFIYPSLYEGFGLQLVEAMACGTPVLAAARASLPEVLGGAGLLFDPESSEDLASKIDMLVFDPNTAATLQERGLERSREFSWEHTATLTLAVYREAMAEAKGREA
jgi:glycosyltransferase involved in cell wall biosynthesis